MSPELLANFNVSAFAHPRLFVTPQDDKRTGRTAYRNAAALVTELIDHVEIDVDNTFTVRYTNGGLFKSGAMLGRDKNTCYTLQALIDGRAKIIVNRYDGACMVLNDTEEYKEATFEVEVEEVEEAVEFEEVA